MDEKLRLGGMALPNGVLVHGPHSWACAIRHEDGRISRQVVDLNVQQATLAARRSRSARRRRNAGRCWKPARPVLRPDDLVDQDESDITYEVDEVGRDWKRQ